MQGVDDRSGPLGRYSEEDNAATAFFDTPRPEPCWLVQVSPFDRRLWSRERVLQELLRQGGLIHRDTLVWRGGMNDWRRLEQLEELHGNTPLPPPPRAPRPRLSLVRATLLYAVAALLTVSAALSALRVAGVFEAGVAAGEASSAR
jgi:hypothetical protein